MLDLKFIRENAQAVAAGLKNKGSKVDLDAIIEEDQQRRNLLQSLEALKHERKNLSEKVNTARREGTDATSLIEAVRNISPEIKQQEQNLRDIEAQLQDKLDRLPNLPHSSAPIGRDASQNIEIKKHGDFKKADFPLNDHLEIGERLELFDFSRGSKISGRGFVVYTGRGARLERALLNFMMDTHATRGYREIYPPFLVNRNSMYGTGQLPKLEEDMYLCNEDDLFLIPTAEVPVTNMFRDEILSTDQVPQKLCAFSACFRREAGSWGKDTRGFQRLHQFNKVELVKITEPQDSYQELEELLVDATHILEQLELPYRVIELCSGDLSFAAAKCYDIELWSPVEEKWLEVSSCSNFEDFQARRMNLRYRAEGGGKPQYPHTLNGSGVATPRLLLALLETFQQADGSVLIPRKLQPYCGFEKLTADRL